MPTREPKFWAVTIVTSLLTTSGGTGALNYFWFNPNDGVIEYRMDQAERKNAALLREVEALKTRIGLLPPPDWRMKINDLERRVRQLSDAMIRLERHGHPEADYEHPNQE